MTESIPIPSSIITTSNIASNDEDDDNEDIQMDQRPSVNDVIVVKSNECKSTGKYSS